MRREQDPLKIALNLLNYRWRSEKELRTKLADKGFQIEEINKVIDFLSRNKLIDDKRFAESWIRQRLRFRPSGRFVISRELENLGVNKSHIENAWDKVQLEEETVTDELQLAIEAGRHKLSSYRSLSNDVFARRLLGFLQRRGFSYHVAKKALAILEKEV